jgi:hypothetical protein
MMNFRLIPYTNTCIISPETIPPPFEVLFFLTFAIFLILIVLNNFFSCNKLVVPQIYLLVQIKLFLFYSNLIYSKMMLLICDFNQYR